MRHRYPGQNEPSWGYILFLFAAVVALLLLSGCLSAHVYGDPRCFYLRCAIEVNP